MLNSLYRPDRVLAGTSSAAQRLRLQIDRVAPYFRTAVLVGERGCLKEQVARALQTRSPLREHPFHVHRASTLAGSALDADMPATVYVAGIGQLGLEQQLLLLTRLRSQFRSGRPELRFICSTEVPPRGLVAAGKLHADLYTCLSAVEIRIAPLRERIEDLPALLDGIALDPATFSTLGTHHWPGNLRELHALVAESSARAGSGSIAPEHLPGFSAAQPEDEGDLRLESVMRRHVTQVLEGCAGNKLRAAETLGISRSTLYRMLEAREA